MAVGRTAVALVLFSAMAAAAMASAQTGPARPATVRAASVHDCDQSRYHAVDRLGSVSSIMSVRNMGCASAVRVVRRYGRSAWWPPRHFRLGPFSCVRYYHNYEDNQARCVSHRRAFRVDYGS